MAAVAAAPASCNTAFSAMQNSDAFHSSVGQAIDAVTKPPVEDERAAKLRSRKVQRNR